MYEKKCTGFYIRVDSIKYVKVRDVWNGLKKFVWTATGDSFHDKLCGERR